MKIIFSNRYSVDLGDHPWRMDKFQEIVKRLQELPSGTSLEILEPAMAEDEDILSVHTLEYWKKLCTGSFSDEEELLLELPITPALVEVFWRMTGGTILATEVALEEGLCVHIGGGMHHAFPNHGTGFCLINDIAVSVRRVIERGLAKHVAIIDCDLHQGDGTAWIFRKDTNVATFSIHQAGNFPGLKRQSTIDIELEDGLGDRPYLELLEKGLDNLFEAYGPFDLIHYQAGADPFEGDILGGLSLSIEGLQKRDKMVLGKASEHGIPTVVTMGGGYAESFDDLVRIHTNTVLAALQFSAGSPASMEN